VTGKRSRHKLKAGFTTGTAAAAAAKAAVLALLGKYPPAKVRVRLLTGDFIDIVVHGCSVENAFTASATVIKDAGDDPDVTHRAEIGARVTLLEPEKGLVITGGPGVGRITRPGLEVAPGSPAINPGPQKMIRQSVRQVLDDFADPRGAAIEIFVPEGEKIAKHTLNARLGIIGGISILGTTGVVKPMSHEAYIATISSGMSVAKAAGSDVVVCTTGRRSERHAQALFSDLPEPAFVQIGDYFEKSMQMASDYGFTRAVLAVFFGKAVKMAQGAAHTHAARSRMGLETLAGWVQKRCPDKKLARQVASANTARSAFFIIRDNCPAVLADTAGRMISSAAGFTGRDIKIRAIIFDYEGGVAADSAEAKGAL